MNYVIHNSEGDTSVTPMTDAQLDKFLADEYWGPVKILDKIPENNDTNYWGDWETSPLLIIRGDIYVPPNK